MTAHVFQARIHRDIYATVWSYGVCVRCGLVNIDDDYFIGCSNVRVEVWRGEMDCERVLARRAAAPKVER